MKSRRLVFQLRRRRTSAKIVKAMVANLLKLGGAVGDKGPSYINVDFKRSDWPKLRAKLKTDSPLANCAIVVYEGKHGWKDYAVLHHYEKSRRSNKTS